MTYFYQINQQTYALFISFVVGGVSSYFIKDYIELKNKVHMTVSKNKDDDKVTKRDIDHDPFAFADDMHSRMQKRMEKVFGRSLLNDSFFGGSVIDDSLSLSNVSDGIQVEEHEDSDFKYVEVLAEGVDKDSLNINIADGMISISGEIRKSNDDQTGDRYYKSHFISSFNRRFNIPYGVDPEKVKIDTEDDRIVIKFPKKRV